MRIAFRQLCRCLRNWPGVVVCARWLTASGLQRPSLLLIATCDSVIHCLSSDTFGRSPYQLRRMLIRTQLAARRLARLVLARILFCELRGRQLETVPWNLFCPG